MLACSWAKSEGFMAGIIDSDQPYYSTGTALMWQMTCPAFTYGVVK